MVSPYRQMVDGIMNSQEKSIEGRVCRIEESDYDFLASVTKALSEKNKLVKKQELEKALLYLQDRINEL